MAFKIDITFCQYAIGVILLIYNLILYIIWNVALKNYQSTRYRGVCLHVVLLIIAFIYTISLALYARSLFNTPEYDIFLNSQFWHWRYSPVLIFFFLSSIRLTRWAIITIKLNYLKNRNTK